MKISDTIDRIYARLESRGYRSTMVSIDHVHQMQSRFETELSNGLINPEVRRAYLTNMSFSKSDNIADPRSVIIVAEPQPSIEVIFTVNCNKLPTIIPPTYLHSNDAEVENMLTGLLNQQGYTAARAILPVKLLAVHSGLAKYGKNNIAYISGLGSYHRLLAFYTDCPCPEDNWGDLQALDECRDCQACTKKCPTGAISADGFRIQAERCLTFFNEQTPDFPDWIDPSWHHCLVGCLHCQKACPVNKDIKDWIQPSVEFSQEETALLLKGTALDDLPVETTKKLKQIYLDDSLDILPRNLNQLMQKPE
ncbi:MAG: hypothetical protein GY841_22035 [FCB group bacterium]|nr:hypothetical protein [FCB group bacterium]